MATDKIEEMTEFSSKLLAFDLPFYEIYAVGYDLMKDIIDFWTFYELDMCKDYFIVLSTIEGGRSEIKKNADQSEAFLIAMTRLIIAYYVAHVEGLDFGKIDLSSLENYTENKKGLEINKKIYQFFNRTTINQTNKL